MASLWKDFLDAPGYLEESPWFPNPAICARDIIGTGVKEVYERMPWNGLGTWLVETGNTISECHYTDSALLLHSLLATVVLTLLRVFLNQSLFKPIAKWFQMIQESAEKFPESIWKSIFYISSAATSIYLVAMSDNNLFFHLNHHWETYSCDLELEPALYCLYVMELGFYVHSMYATTFMETIRKDYHVMMMHHMLTVVLLYFSYIVRFHLLGLMLIFSLDMGDFILEFSKIVHYLKDRGNQKTPITDAICNICFAIFTLQHFLLRIYWFPTKLMYSAMYVSVMLVPRGPFYLFFNPMIVLLYAMQVYWFKYILRLLWKILIQGDQLSDIREYEERPKMGEINDTKKEE